MSRCKDLAEETDLAVHLQSPQNEDVYVKTSEVARMLRVSPKTVSRWAQDGKLPYMVTLGGHRRFPARAIQDIARRLRSF